MDEICRKVVDYYLESDRFNLSRFSSSALREFTIDIEIKGE